ncbi:MAG: phage virion morphogenesis protein [Treponema sp.]|jgi:phage gpG-like protein|nr:phage virion morphogenesis protein [Treponema sp.]
MGVKIVARPSKKAGSIARVPEAFKHIAHYLRSRADKRIKEGVPPPNSPLTARVKRGNLTLRDSGALMRSLATHAGDLWADTSTKLKYARIQQEGGTIRSKGKGLWIPAGPETRRLMKRYGTQKPGALIAAMKADDYDFFSRKKVFCAYKKGKTLKNGRKGPDGKPFALFVIRSSVTIPARPFLHIDRADELYILNYLGIAIRDALEKGKGKKS